MTSPSLARAEAAEAKLEEYQLRLAGALTALDGHAVDQSDPKMIPYLRSCPTIEAAIRERRGREAAEAKLAEAQKAWRESRDPLVSALDRLKVLERALDYVRRCHGESVADAALAAARKP